MKSFFLTAILLMTVSSQASFVESPYLYGLKKRHAEMVHNNGDIDIDLEYMDHGKWVNISTIVDKFAGEGVFGLMGYEVNQLNPKTAKQELLDLLDPREEEFYYCYPLQQSADSSYSEEECASSLARLIGDAADLADRVDVLQTYGDYYGDWETYVIIFSDYETKETMALDLPVYHEI